MGHADDEVIEMQVFCDVKNPGHVSFIQWHHGFSEKSLISIVAKLWLTTNNILRLRRESEL